MEDQLHRLDRLRKFNLTYPAEQEQRQAMMKEMFAEVGEHDRSRVFNFGALGLTTALTTDRKSLPPAGGRL